LTLLERERRERERAREREGKCASKIIQGFVLVGVYNLGVHHNRVALDWHAHRGSDKFNERTALPSIHVQKLLAEPSNLSADVSMSAYASIRQHTPDFVSIRQHKHFAEAEPSNLCIPS
jgi:hypothetical protein